MTNYIQVWKADSVLRETSCYKKDLAELTDFLESCELGLYEVTTVDMLVEDYNSLPDPQRF